MTSPAKISVANQKYRNIKRRLFPPSFFRVAALLVVAIEPAMSPPRALPCEKNPFQSPALGGVVESFASILIWSYRQLMPFHRIPNPTRKLPIRLLLMHHCLTAYASFYVFRLHTTVSKVSLRWREM